MTEMSTTSKVGIVLATIFVILQFLFQIEKFTLASLIIMFLLVAVAFFSETNRLFVWLIISYMAGFFAFIYLDRILLELSLSPIDLFIWNRLLLLIPIVLICYVLFMFKEHPIPFLRKPNWEFPFSLWGIKLWSPRTFFHLFIFIHLFILLVLIAKALPIEPVLFLKVLLYGMFNSLFVEFLWRGLLLSRMEIMVGEKPAVIFTSVLSAMVYYMFGFSFAFTVFFFFMSLFLGIITCKTRSLLPAFIWNIILTNILIFLDIIPLLKLGS